MTPTEAKQWINEARAASIPPLATGLVLLHVVLGLSILGAVALLAVLMLPLQIWAARQAFPIPDAPDDWDWTHG